MASIPYIHSALKFMHAILIYLRFQVFELGHMIKGLISHLDVLSHKSQIYVLRLRH